MHKCELIFFPLCWEGRRNDLAWKGDVLDKRKKCSWIACWGCRKVADPLRGEATRDLHVHPANPSPPIRASRVQNLEGTGGPAHVERIENSSVSSWHQHEDHPR